MDEFAHLLDAHNRGSRTATAALFELVYTELRQLARRHWPGSAGQTLSATCLVHEAYLKLHGAGELTLQDRKHFFRLAKAVMRQVITDYARERHAGKRGGGWRPATLQLEDLPEEDGDALVLDLDAARTALAEDEVERRRDCRGAGGVDANRAARVAPCQAAAGAAGDARVSVHTIGRLP